MRPFLALCLLAAALPVLGQTGPLRSGPMLGYVEMREALIWVQTAQPAEVWAEYHPEGQPAAVATTPRVRTEKSKACTAKLVAELLEPGTTYAYRIFVDGQAVGLNYPTTFRTQTLWQWRGDAPDLTVATGSCAYVSDAPYDRPGRPYGGEYAIYQSIAARKPDIMLWLGDNTYLREADWNTRSGILYRYTHTRSVPELQPLLAGSANYAVWDDHDFGPNDSDRSFIHKDLTREAFELFWGNPGFGLPGQGGITTAFSWADIDFFLLDNRWFRSPNDCETCAATILGEAQFDWLIEALSTSRAPFKIVAIGGQVLNTAATFENYANRHREERRKLLERISEENISGVVFLSGDRHHTEISTLTNSKGNVLYDITSSPLTSTASRNNGEEGNLLRMEGTYVNERNFVMLGFSGKRGERVMKVSCHNVAGELLWERSIPQPLRR